jgi:hypothetical protein
MTSIICTLFENDYHFGVAALSNSLYSQGFRGDIYAGYRGNLPPWASNAKISPHIEWPNAYTLDVANDLRIHFLPVDTNSHLTNYKPDFMLQVLSLRGLGNSSIFYFDPDIVVTAEWHEFEIWASCGIALCEDVNSPLSKFHPRRVGWREYFKEEKMLLNFKDAIYVNGGFVGIQAKDYEFISIWKLLQDAMAPALGGLKWSIFDKQEPTKLTDGKFAPFSRSDQDALNAAAEMWEGNVSFLGQDAMGFKIGEILLPHALGTPKPWKLNFLKKSLLGNSPRRVDSEYWKNANGIITLYAKPVIYYKLSCLYLAKFIGRFYAR